MKKSINIQELIDAATSSIDIPLTEEAHPSEKGLQVDTEVSTFINRFNIKQGTNPVPAKLIYKIYKTTMNVDQLSLVQFKNRMELFFQMDKNCYLLDMNSFEFANKFKQLFGEDDTRHRYVSVSKTMNTFIEEYNLKKGKQYIDTKVLHYFFDQHCKDVGVITPKHKKFRNMIVRLLSSKQVLSDTYIAISENDFLETITSTDLQLAEKHAKELPNDKKIISTIKKKISGTGE